MINKTKIINSLIHFMSVSAKSSNHPEAEIKPFSHSLQYFSGCSFPLFNGIFHNYQFGESNSELSITSALDCFTKKKKPFIWWWLDQNQIPVNIKIKLDVHGFTSMGDFMLMAAPIDKMKLNYHSNNIKIKRVDNDEDYRKFIRIKCETFQLSDSVYEEFLAMFSCYGTNGDFIHYIGYYNGVPLATISSSTVGAITGLYNGATLPQAQNKGLCSALMKYAICETKSEGACYAVTQLMATAMAKGLCEKMGFENHGRIQPYLKG